MRHELVERRRLEQRVLPAEDQLPRNVPLRGLLALVLSSKPECYSDHEARRPPIFMASPTRAARCSRTIELSAVDRDLECLADLSHPDAAQSADPLDQHGGRHRLGRVQIDGTAATDRIVTGVENDLARQTSDRGRTRCNDRTTEPRDGNVTRQDHDWSSTDLRRFAPPQLTAGRRRTHVADAALRNEARSPQSSSPSMG